MGQWRCRYECDLGAVFGRRKGENWWPDLYLVVSPPGAPRTCPTNLPHTESWIRLNRLIRRGYSKLAGAAGVEAVELVPTA